MNGYKVIILLIFVCSLVPAGDTEFAKDAAFGYKSSNLRDVKHFVPSFDFINVIYILLLLIRIIMFRDAFYPNIVGRGKDKWSHTCK
jgi:hypothetical protein